MRGRRVLLPHLLLLACVRTCTRWCTLVLVLVLELQRAIGVSMRAESLGSKSSLCACSNRQHESTRGSHTRVSYAPCVQRTTLRELAYATTTSTRTPRAKV